MIKASPFIILVLVLALVCVGCSNPSSLGPDSSPSPLIEPSESPSASVSAEETPLPQESDALPTADAETSILGELTGDQYINKAFGFMAAIPEGWVFASKEELAQVSGQAGDLVESVMDLDTVSSVVLMMCSQVPLGSTEAFNPNINITYSKQADILSALTSAALFDQLLSEFQSNYTELYAQVLSDVSVSTSGEQSLTINGRAYVLVKVDATFEGGTMYQQQYFTEAGDGMITITTTYYASSEKAMMDAFMQSVVFE